MAVACEGKGKGEGDCEALGELERRVEDQRRRLDAEREALLARRRSRRASLPTCCGGEGAAEHEQVMMAEAAAAAPMDAGAPRPPTLPTEVAAGGCEAEEPSAVEAVAQDVAAVEREASYEQRARLARTPVSAARKRWEANMDLAKREEKLQRTREMIAREAPGPARVQELVAERLGRARSKAASRREETEAESDLAV